MKGRRSKLFKNEDKIGGVGGRDEVSENVLKVGTVLENKEVRG